MREEFRLIKALGRVSDRYILEAMPGQKKESKPRMRWLAAVLAIVLSLMFLQTSPGAKAMEFVKEAVVNLIEALFPPKDIVVAPEGSPISVPHVAGGQVPETEESGGVTAPGFAIYYDPSSYTMTEENGVTYIRSIPIELSREEARQNNAGLLEGLSEAEAEAEIDRILAQQQEFYDNLPICGIEIHHIPDVQPQDAAQQASSRLSGTWANQTEVTPCTAPDGYTFTVSEEPKWDSAMEEHFFISDGQGGCFQLIVQYFLEAAEGHGMRLLSALRTFEVLSD